MGLLDDTTQRAYYQGTSAALDNGKGVYQFTSLDDIINQFLVAYVGEEKIINKVSRTDVAFHAQRAMQELSFDTFKSIKSQEIVLPPSNTMILPHDYVNYTKLAWSDSSGIKHPLYPTSETSNPFKIRQEDDGSYFFQQGSLQINLVNYDFSSSLANGWQSSTVETLSTTSYDSVTSSDKLKFHHGSKLDNGFTGSNKYAVWQAIDVTGINHIDLKATVKVAASAPGNYSPTQYNSFRRDAGIVRVGITSSLNVNGWDPMVTNPNPFIFDGFNWIIDPASQNYSEDIFDLDTSLGGPSCITWGDDAVEEDTESTQSSSDVGNSGFINVEPYNEVFVVITSHIPNFTDTLPSTPGLSELGYISENTVDDIEIISTGASDNLQSDGDSTTWSSYKSSTPDENTNPEIYNYDTDVYDFNAGERYGLDPQHAQTNGSFYIDNLRGLINFSSNISGKTVILDYISDSLGTNGEMQVHKFAEEAMYRWILHAIAAGRIQTQQLVPRLKKEKIAAIRQAKLRLSNVKLEELTQILRGKSKHIKH